MCNCNGHTSDPRVVVASADFHDLKVLHSVGGTAPRQSTLLRLMAQADRTDRHRAPAQGAFVSDLCIPQLVTGLQTEAARSTSNPFDRWRSNGGSSSRGAENCLRLLFLRNRSALAAPIYLTCLRWPWRRMAQQEPNLARWPRSERRLEGQAGLRADARVAIF